MNHINCPKCGKELPADARFCFACGAEIPAVIACPKCGRELPAEAKFCTYCGATLKSEAGAARPAAPEEPRTEEKPSVPGSTAPGTPKPGRPKLPELPKLSWAALAAIGGGAAALLLILVLSSGPSRSSGTDSPSGSAPADNPVNASGGASRVLMADTTSNPDAIIDAGILSDQPIFGTDITREEVTSVTFFDLLGPLDASDYTWDVSEAQDGSVILGASKHDSGYNVFICADADIIMPEDCSFMFAGYTNAQFFDFNDSVDMGNTTTMESMFADCKSVEVIEFKGLDTSHVTNMSDLFKFDEKLRIVDMNGLDVSQVTDMDSMFAFCKKLEDARTEGWDTSSVRSMNGTFYDCITLAELDLDHWDTSNVTDMQSMFNFCNNLRALHAGSWDTSHVVNMEYMFSSTFSLELLEVDNWETAHLPDMNKMFFGSKLKDSPIAQELLEGKQPASGKDTPAPTSTPSPESTPEPSASAEPSASLSGTTTTISGTTLPDPSEFLHGKLKHRERDISGGVEIHFYFDKTSKSAAYEYADLLGGKSVDLTLRQKYDDSKNGLVSTYYVYDYAGSGSADSISVTTTLNHQNFEAPVIVCVLEFGNSGVSSNWLYLTIYCSNDFSFADSGDRSTDSTFEDFYNTYDPDTAFLGPVGTGFKYGGSSGGSSSGFDSGSSTEREKINCPSCGGSGKKQCYTCNGTGIERHYKSGGSANGAAPGEWVSERCGTCDGKGTIKCIPCQGTGKV